MKNSFVSDAPISSYLADPDRPRMARVLLIEDDAETAYGIMSGLADYGYIVDWAATGSSGLDKGRTGGADVMIVDRMLPGMDGLTVIDTLRREDMCPPALVVSALSAVDDRVCGLRMGGDDYLAKPFAVIELIARIEVLLRRSADATTTVLRVGPLEVELIGRTAKRGGREIELLPREFCLLVYMMRRQGQLLTRAMLFEDVWNYKFVPDSNLVDVHMGRLRRKVDRKGEQPMIFSVRGEGFVLHVPV